MTLGELPPEIVVPPPGPRSRALAARLAQSEAPGVNTLPAAAEDDPPIVWAMATGANVTDVDGNRYVDLTSGFGVAALGHRHPAVHAALRGQSERLWHGLGDVQAHDLRPLLAERLAALAPFPGAQVFFAVTGAEAVEIALKTAVLNTRRHELLAFEPAYHGLTLGALAVTSRPAFRTPFAAHLHPHVHRLPFGGDLEAVAQLLATRRLAAVIVEPIVGREGVLVPPGGWLAGLGSLARASGTLTIADEIFTGFGRTGSLFAAPAAGLVPDLLCCGKALGGGMPIAAVLAPGALFAVWRTPGEALHTSTFLAQPLACAAALAVLEVLEREGLPARAGRLGAVLGKRLAAWPERWRSVRATRGRGFLWGVELSSVGLTRRLTRALANRGYLALAGGSPATVVQLVPPLTIPEGLLERALSACEDEIARLDADAPASPVDGDPGPGSPIQ